MFPIKAEIVFNEGSVEQLNLFYKISQIVDCRRNSTCDL